MISSKLSQTSCYQCGYHITLPFSQNLTYIANGSYLLSYSGISDYIKHMLTPKCYVYMIICLRFMFKKKVKTLFILQRLPNDLYTLYSSFSLAQMFAFRCSSCCRKPKYPRYVYNSNSTTEPSLVTVSERFHINKHCLSM